MRRCVARPLLRGCGCSGSGLQGFRVYRVQGLGFIGFRGLGVYRVQGLGVWAVRVSGFRGLGV